jgi:hypothetical protein
MTTTDILGKIVCSDGSEHMICCEPTDAAAESAVTLKDLTATSQNFDTLQGRTIIRIAIQASDGSILTSLNLYDAGGGKTHSFYGGERVAGTGETWNLDLRGLSIPIAKGCAMKIVTND